MRKPLDRIKGKHHSGTLGKFLHGLYSFNENFGGQNGDERRVCEFGNGWIRTKAGKWIDLTEAKFTHDGHGKSERLDRSGLTPACVVCLTDLETTFPAAPPAAPVLWAVVGDNRCDPPFGRAVRIGP